MNKYIWWFIAIVMISFVAFKAWGAEDCSNGVTETVIAPDQEFALCWNKNADEELILKYKVYKDGQLIAEVAPTNCDTNYCWSARMFPSGIGSFVYTVRASNAADDSTDSNVATVVVISKPTAPIGCGIIKF